MSWPTHRDGRAKRLEEMTAAERQRLLRALERRAA